MARFDLEKLLRALPPIEIPHPVPTTFYPFPRLPNELKNKIWSYVVSEPRYVRIYDFDQAFAYLLHSPLINGQFPVPPLLHVNQQAREEGLRNYTRCMEKGFDRKEWELYYGKDSQRPNRRVVFINFKVDRFLYDRCDGPFDPRDILPIDQYNFAPKVMKKCQHVAIVHQGRGTPQDRNNLKAAAVKVGNLLAMDKAIDVTVVARDWAIKAMAESVDGDLMRNVLREVFLRTSAELEQKYGIERQIGMVWKEEAEVQLSPWSGSVDSFRHLDKAVPLPWLWMDNNVYRYSNVFLLG